MTAVQWLVLREVGALLVAGPDARARKRDHALMSLLYNTGARIQEALDLRPQDIHFKSPAHVRIMGKGRKERISPIWPETADLVTALIRRQPRKPDEPIFVNRYRSPLTASGFRFRLRQYVEAAAEVVPTISKKRVTPHVFRQFDSGPSGCCVCRCYCDSKLARARTLGYDQPLRSGKSGDEAEGPRTGRSQVPTDQAAAMEARHRSVGLARFSVIGSTGGAPNIGGIMPSKGIPFRLLLLACSDHPG